MRLIDADEFKKQIAGMTIINNYPEDKANNICELIDCQPTAYDLDKVVEEIRKYADNIAELGGNFLPEVVIKIVKSGGVSND